METGAASNEVATRRYGPLWGSVDGANLRLPGCGSGTRWGDLGSSQSDGVSTSGEDCQTG